MEQKTKTGYMGYAYDASGRMTAVAANSSILNPKSSFQNPGFQPFGFQSGLYDPDTGLVQFRARWYDPSTGRWLSKDPILLEGGLNLYAFCGNDPVNFTDPWGLSFWSSFGQGVVRGAIGAAIVAAGAATAITVGVPAAVVTTGLAITGAVGGGFTLCSVLVDHSADNIGYNLGAVAGGAIVGGASGRAFATRLSPLGNQPASGWSGWSPIRDYGQRWHPNFNQTVIQNIGAAMETGPNPLSAAGSVDFGGSGLALMMRPSPDTPNPGK